MLLGLLPMLVVGACQGPSRANIELRKRNAELTEQIDLLQRQRTGDQATIKTLEAQRDTVSYLPDQRLEKLFTVHGIALSRLCGGSDTDSDHGGDEALRVVFTPQDQFQQNLKAAGSVQIELFDLSLQGDQRIGRWEFSTTDAMNRWIDSGLISAYAFELPWQQAPAHTQLTLKISFVDELTGRTFSAQTPVNIRLPDAPAAENQPPNQP
ncbi:MAG: hypothetical protein IT448_08305 [Phycisphaerales bacterium]|nr:hypothetical protein [Phycisphaerales bacterium]